MLNRYGQKPYRFYLGAYPELTRVQIRTVMAADRYRVPVPLGVDSEFWTQGGCRSPNARSRCRPTRARIRACCNPWCQPAMPRSVALKPSQIDAVPAGASRPPDKATDATVLRAAASTRFAVHLDGRTGHRAIGTIDAAVARLGLQYCMTLFALIEPLACIGGHRLNLYVSASGAGQGRFTGNIVHGEFRASAEG